MSRIRHVQNRNRWTTRAIQWQPIDGKNKAVQTDN